MGRRVRRNSLAATRYCKAGKQSVFLRLAQLQSAFCRRANCSGRPVPAKALHVHVSNAIQFLAACRLSVATAAEVLLCSCSPIPPFEAFVADLPGPGHSLELPCVCKENSGPRLIRPAPRHHFQAFTQSYWSLCDFRCIQPLSMPAYAVWREHELFLQDVASTVPSLLLPAWIGCDMPLAQHRCEGLGSMKTAFMFTSAANRVSAAL